MENKSHMTEIMQKTRIELENGDISDDEIDAAIRVRRLWSSCYFFLSFFIFVFLSFYFVSNPPSFGIFSFLPIFFWVTICTVCMQMHFQTKTITTKGISISSDTIRMYGRWSR